MSRIRIAIVDDHQLFREGLYSLLMKNDAYQVVISVNNGVEFMESLSAGVKPEVVLLDLSMPEMDGFEVLKKLKKGYPEVKAIALSMHDDGNYIVKCIRYGAYGYLLKNADEEELITAIGTVLRGRKYFNQEITSHMIDIMSIEGMDARKLSPKETEVLTLISEGQTTKEIANQLFVSVRTVETHRVNIMKKLNARNTAEMIKIATQLQLIK